MDRLQAHIALVDHLGFDRAGQYIAEAEHQEGYGFWDNFETEDELLQDADKFFSEKTHG